MFSIGLASHTMKFDMHFKNPITNTFIFFGLLGIIGAGVTTVVLTDFKVLQVNPESMWPNSMELPPFEKIDLSASPTVYNDSIWYPLVNKFQIAESCEGIADAVEACNALDFKVDITATSGLLRLNLSAEDTLAEAITQSSQDASGALNIVGKLDVVNQLLAGAEFSPACDAVDPGKITLLVKAVATGP